jgi:hypothetical protein
VLVVLVSLVFLLFAGAALASIEVTVKAPGALRTPNGLRAAASIMAGECGPEEGSDWMSSRELLGGLTYFYVNNFTHTNKQLEQYRCQMLSIHHPGQVVA